MPISFNRYVSITSGIGAGAAVRRRELIARLFHTNPLTPTGTILEFTELADVGRYYGTDTEEFRRAAFYFGFVSKNQTRPKRISYGRWASAATAPQVFGTANPATLAQFTAITAGSFTLVLGGTSETFTAIDLSSVSSFADVATAIQTAVRTGTETNFTGATVVFDVSRQAFHFTGGETGAATVTVTAGATNDVAGLLGWLTGAIVSNGVAVETVTDVLTNTTEFNNNFGSFTFISPITEAQTTEAATWNDGQNFLFQYHVSVLPTDAATVSGNLIALAGTGITLGSPTTPNEYPEMLPMAILAATDYTRRASTQNYMFYEAALTPTVRDNAGANLYDPLRVNYYGETQTAGQLRRFYQRGVLTGGSSDATDMNVYANEQWLKDDAGARIMTLLLALPKVSANQRGRGQLLSIIRATINQALLNGTISVGRPLTPTQVIFITEQTGDERAFQQVATSGYWIDVRIVQFQTTDNRTEFRGEYTLIYTKDDVIRMVNGTHTLI